MGHSSDSTLLVEQWPIRNLVWVGQMLHLAPPIIRLYVRYF